MEAASAHVPVVAIASQIPRDLIGAGRGYLHELPDQKASFEPGRQVGGPRRGRRGDPGAARRGLAPGARRRRAGPSSSRSRSTCSPGDGRSRRRPRHDSPRRRPLRTRRAHEAAGCSSPARARRSSGRAAASSAPARGTSCALVAERLGAPVATTYMGKGAFPEDDPLALGTACDEPAFKELVERSRRRARRRHRARRRDDRAVRAAPLRHASSTSTPTRAGSGRPTRRSGSSATRRPCSRARRAPPGRAARRRRSQGRRGQEAHRGRPRRPGARAPSAASCETVRDALPRDAVTAWDMTILAYWAAAHFPVLRAAHLPLSARLGDARLRLARRARRLARRARPAGRSRSSATAASTTGIAELAAARQYGLDAKLLLVDDGGYGILREYQRDQFGETTSVDLVEPDFRALVEAFGVPVRLGAPGGARRRPGRGLRRGRPGGRPRPRAPGDVDSDRLEPDRPPVADRPGAVPAGREPRGAEGGATGSTRS